MPFFDPTWLTGACHFVGYSERPLDGHNHHRRYIYCNDYTVPANEQRKLYTL